MYVATKVIETLLNRSSPVLVLGLCFFAGGMRFSEQGFDASKQHKIV